MNKKKDPDMIRIIFTLRNGKKIEGGSSGWSEEIESTYEEIAGYLGLSTLKHFAVDGEKNKKFILGTEVVEIAIDRWNV